MLLVLLLVLLVVLPIKPFAAAACPALVELAANVTHLPCALNPFRQTARAARDTSKPPRLLATERALGTGL